MRVVDGVVNVPAYTDFKLRDITSGPGDPNREPLDMNQPAGTPGFFAGLRETRHDFIPLADEVSSKRSHILCATSVGFFAQTSRCDSGLLHRRHKISTCARHFCRDMN